MNGRRAVVGLCMLCALLVSAFAAQSASAITGTTAFTCTTGGAKDYATSDTHCKTNVGAGNGTLGHVAITEKTSITGSNKTTGEATEPTVLKATIGGVATELVATGVNGTGTMENKLNGSEHVAHGTGTINYTGVTVAKPAGKNCVVKADNGGVEGTTGSLSTNKLTATTQGAGMGLKFTPETGEVFATFFISGCEAPFTSLNKTYEVKGSVIGEPQGATTVFTHGTKEPPTGVTGQNTLNLNGTIPSGINGSLTLTGPTGTPLTATTVET